MDELDQKDLTWSNKCRLETIWLTLRLEVMIIGIHCDTQQAVYNPQNILIITIQDKEKW